MTIKKAMRLAAQWASGGVCTLREGEAREYHKTCYEALKKQIPMEHHHTIVGECHDEKARGSVCPSCLGYIVTVAEEFPRFCTWCGQAIDWDD